MPKSRLTINDRNLERVVEACDEIAKILSEAILQRWKINIYEAGNVDTSEYVSSLQIEKLSNGNWRIFSNLEYPTYIEYGTGPSVGKPSYIPPFQPIRDWVESKLGYSGKEADAVAWFIIRKIEKEGIDPSPSARPALQQVSYRAIDISREILLKVTR